MGLYVDTIQKLYIAYFGRPADPDGLRFWQDIVIANGGDISGVSAAMAQSAEYIAHFTDKGNRAIVDDIYMQLFGRHAEAGGLDYWSAKLDAGHLTVSNVVTTIMKAAQGTDQVAVEMKVAAATIFTDSVASHNLGSAWGDAAVGLARSSLDKVFTSDGLLQFSNDLKGAMLDQMRVATVADAKAAGVAVGEPNPDGKGVAVGEPNPGGKGVAVGEPNPNQGVAVGKFNPNKGIAAGEPHPGQAGFAFGEPNPSAQAATVDQGLDLKLIGSADFSNGMLFI